MSFAKLLSEIRACRVCEEHLPHGPRPVIQAHRSARILVVGQAPGIRVHESGLPFNDPSGVRLRDWMDVDREQFYDDKLIALVPMGFCYPGTGRSGDLPPRAECAPTWRQQVLSALPNVQVTLVIGRYAQNYHLPEQGRSSVTEIVRAWRDFAPKVFVLPHPSPRNNIWLRKNPWFEEEVLPALRRAVSAALPAYENSRDTQLSGR